MIDARQNDVRWLIAYVVSTINTKEYFLSMKIPDLLEDLPT